MKHRPQRDILPVMLAVLCSALVSQLRAQTFTVLHSFSVPGTYAGVDTDGSHPQGGLIVSSDAIYGTTENGGVAGYGTVFKVNADGTGYKVLHFFTALNSSGLNRDGNKPNSTLLLLNNTIYGTAGAGGTNGSGTVFSLNTDGTGFTTLYNFSGDDGATPAGGLLLLSNILFGTTRSGGTWNRGTVFSLNTDGTSFTTLHSFTGGSDGQFAWGSLALLGNTLYGATTIGGSSNYGTLFAINTDGTGFTNLYSFTGLNDGGAPHGGLILSGGRIYGTATDFGAGYGTLFSINTDGSDFAVLHSFTGTNSDGANPSWAGLTLAGKALYGTTIRGGFGGSGTVFSINTDGTGFVTKYVFTKATGLPLINKDGVSPYAGVSLLSSTLYGTASSGGSSGNGTIFSISLAVALPQLAITQAGAQAILSWPTNFTGFILQSSTNLSSPIWTTNLPAPVVVKGQNTITNSISGMQQFFRLSR